MRGSGMCGRVTPSYSREKRCGFAPQCHRQIKLAVGQYGESDPHLSDFSVTSQARSSEIRGLSMSAGPFGTDLTRNTVKTAAFNELSHQISIIFIVACP